MRMMGAESVAYHRETVMGRADDHAGLAMAYYASRGETPLAWGGSGTVPFGLAGAVTDSQYDRVFGPGGFRDPTTGTPLVATRRPGLELVVSAHKSVALLGVLGWAEEMHAILDAETDATLRYLDEVVRSAGGRRGRAQTRTATSGLLWARTRHATSRAGDPEPHDHVLIANVVEMLDERGGRKALDTALIRDQLHAATMVGRVAAARRAVELGFAIEADPGPSGRLGHWRVAGVPTQLCEMFSKRAAEIDDAMGAAGFDTYQGRQVAARTTRRAKRHSSPDELLPRWIAELEAAGFTREQLQVEVAETAQRRAVPERPDTDKLEGLARQVLGRFGRLAELKVFTRSDVIVAVAPALFGQEPRELDWAVDRVVSHPDAIPLIGVPHARGQAYSPACVIAVEQAIVDVMDEGATRTDAARADYPVVEAAIWAKETQVGAPLTIGQTDAAVALCTSGLAVEMVIGVAGAGKTTMLDVVRAAFEHAGFRVIGTATSGQAAQTLGRDAGLTEARTVASLLWRMDHGKVSLDARTILIVDEAAMTDDPAVLRLLSTAGAAGAKAILVGDHRQLGAVGPSGALEGLLVRHRDAVHVLRDNVRQSDPAERTALAQLRAGDVTKAIDWYVEHGRIVAASTRDRLLDKLVDAWATDAAEGRETVMLAWRRTNVAELNRLARDRWRQDGNLEGPELVVEGERRYQSGDRVVTLAPASDGRLVTSEHGTVESVEPAAGRLVLHMADDRRVTLDAAEAGLDRLDHGYAITVHRSQGGTIDAGHRLADGGGRELAYVSMSRARDRSTVYVVADDLEQARGDLAHDWTAEGRQRWAIDIGTPSARAAEVGPGPEVSGRLGETIRRARLESERDAILDVIPPDVTVELKQARNRLVRLQLERHQLERGIDHHLRTPEGSSAWQRHQAERDLDSARHHADDRQWPRADRRRARRRIEALEGRLAAANERWERVGAPILAELDARIAEASEIVDRLSARVTERAAWLEKHPEALPRLHRLDQERALLAPDPPAHVAQVVGIENILPTRGDVPERYLGPELDL
jgi:conjugative relaxase-like TrwC/TraI family protein